MVSKCYILFTDFRIVIVFCSTAILPLSVMLLLTWEWKSQQMLQGLPYLPGLELVLGSIPRVVYISLPNTAFPTYTESMSKLLR